MLKREFHYLVIEENIVVEIFVAEASDQLKGELGELTEVVPRQLALLVVVGKRHRRHLSVLVVVFALQVEGVLLDLGVAERLQDSTPVCSKEVVGHIGVEVQVVRVIEEVPFLGCVFELLVVVVDDTDPICFTVSQVARKVAADSRPKEWRDSPGWGQMVLVDIVQYLLILET